MSSDNDKKNKEINTGRCRHRCSNRNCITRRTNNPINLNCDYKLGLLSRKDEIENSVVYPFEFVDVVVPRLCDKCCAWSIFKLNLDTGKRKFSKDYDTFLKNFQDTKSKGRYFYLLYFYIYLTSKNHLY
jgi:hypothetical protein